MRKEGPAGRYVFGPGDPLKKAWDLLIIIMLGYTASFTPFQIAFYGDVMTPSNISQWPFFFTLDRFADLIFLLDVIVQLRTAWISPEGLVVFHAQTAFWRYFRGWFIWDVLSLTPFELLEFTAIGNSPFLRLPKLVRLVRLSKVKRLLSESDMVKRFEETTTFKYGWMRLFKFTGIILTVSHWMACIVFLFSTFNREGQGWVNELRIEDAPVSVQYTTSLYWAIMTLTSVGYGDIVARTYTERWVFIVLLLLSAGVYAYIVGTIVSLVQGLDAEALEFQNGMDEMNEYMKNCRLPGPVQNRIRKYLFYKKNAVLKIHTATEQLSPAIRKEIALYNFERALASVPQFRGAPPAFLSAMAIALRPVVYGPNEVILAMKRTSNSLFIINEGRVQWERIGPDGKIVVVRVLKSGSYFGEGSLLKNEIRSDSTFRTVSFVEGCELRRKDVDPIMNEYPDVKRIVQLSWMKEILFRNMRNGCLRRVAEAPAFQRLQRVESQLALERGTSISSSLDNINDISIQEAFLDMRSDMRATNKKLDALASQVKETNELLTALVAQKNNSSIEKGRGQ